MPLYHWQEPAAARLAEILQQHGAALNASDTGTGKTFVALDVLRRLNRRGIVLTPKSVITAWHKAAETLGVADRVAAVLNIEALMTGKTPWWNKGAWHMPAETMLVIDEVHKGCSGPKTKTTEVVALSKAFHVPVLAQSATIADSPLKMRAIGFLLGLHSYNVNSFYSWCRANGCITSPFHNGLEFPKGPLGHAAMLKMHELVSPYTVRQRIEDIPEFPESEVQCNLYDLATDYTAEINAIYESMAAKLKEPGVNPMVELLRVRQRTELLKVPLFKDLVLDFLEEGRSVVVFLCFRETMTALQRALDNSCVQIYGGQSQSERDAAVNLFQGNLATVCLCMSQAGGVGISLHDVLHERPRAALLSPDYNAVNMIQCLGRIHRAGGTKVLQIFVLAANTVEERVHRAISRKLKNIDAINDGDLSLLE